MIIINQKEIIRFIEGLDVINVDVLKDFGYDDPSDVLSMDIVLSKIDLKHSQGFMRFESDSIDFDALHNTIVFYKDDKPYVEKNIKDIVSIEVRMVEN